LLFLVILGSTVYLNTYIAVAETTPAIPSITSNMTEIITSNMGPVVPVIVSPGESFIIELRPEYSSLSISSAYIWTVKPVDNQLVVYNYTLSISSMGPGIYQATISAGVEDGLYDLSLLAGSTVYNVPRSVWVVKSWPSVIRFVENTDIHFIAGQPNPFTGDINRIAGFTIDNLLSPFFILWLGDITDNAASSEYMMALAYRYAYLYNIPVLSIPGNHDYASGGTYYTNYLGPTKWFRVIAGKLLIIGIWSPEQGYPSWEDLVFAQQVLQNYSSIPYKMILVHHPPFYYQGELYTRYDDETVLKPYVPGGPSTPLSSYWSNNMTAFRYFLKLVEDYNVTMVLSGHTHRDFFTKYVSTRTGTTTLFLTFTTLAHGSASYDGLSLMEFDLNTGRLDFPLKPSTFIGFQNSTRALALNSIPIGIYPVQNNLGWSNLTFTYMNVVYSDAGYTFRFENNNLSWINFSGTILWSLPWAGNNINYRIVNALNNASIKIIDYKIIGGRLFLLFELNLPFQSGLTLRLYTDPDPKPPVVFLRRIVPQTPSVNRDVTIYIEISDEGLGIDPSSIVVRLGDNVINYSSMPQRNAYTMTPSTYTEKFNTITLLITVYVISNTTVMQPLLIQVADNAGNTASTQFNITFVGPTLTTTTTTTPTTTPTTMTTTTTTTTTTVTTTPTTTASTTPTTTTTTTTAITTTTSTTTTTTTTTATTTAQTTTTTPSGEAPSSYLIMLGIVVVVVVIILLVSLIRRSSGK
jgi:predicted MPP superfamily phosphohydrolase